MVFYLEVHSITNIDRYHKINKYIINHSFNSGFWVISEIFVVSILK